MTASRCSMMMTDSSIFTKRGVTNCPLAGLFAATHGLVDPVPT